VLDLLSESMGHQLPATLGVMGGFAVMMVLDNAYALT
jgi:hypothetical protein